MEKVYKRPIDNIYSHSFYSELFSGYEYSLSEEKINRRDFYIIIPDDKEIVELFGNGRHYDFSYEFSQSIDRVLYSMAVYGKAYHAGASGRWRTKQDLCVDTGKGGRCPCLIPQSWKSSTGSWRKAKRNCEKPSMMKRYCSTS